MMNTTHTNTRKIYEGEGRFGRASYIAWNFIIFIISMICMIVLIGAYWTDISAVFNLTSYDDYETIVQIQEVLAPLNAFSSLINFVYLYFMFVFSIKRLHDLNRSGWMSLLNLIPLVNLFFAVWLSMAIGTQGKNNFGYPRITQPWEYTLAWISIIFMTLLGIGLVIALLYILSSFPK